MKTINIKEFEDFCLDHIKHFDAIPLEFEDSNGVEIGPEKCWNLAVRMNLTSKIIDKGII